MPQKLNAQVAETLVALGDDFVSTPVDPLELSLEGVVGDSQHFGFVRKSSSREPWHKRGTPVKNDRQVSVVCPAEMQTVATRMELPKIEGCWIGANIVLAGIERLSFLPRGARIIFPSGATLFVVDQNAPCRFAGASIARHFPDREGLDLLFPKHAQGLRGFVAFVERAGTVKPGETAEVLLPAKQWVYDPRPQLPLGDGMHQCP